MEHEIFVPRTERERENVVALVEYLRDIYCC
ncbi:hypothetical protein LCGC14_0573370 [marine sediment metagenome]|uniref:Uncharacterized protein n=1 Tax=marine sediment metagenome TaxID=412755 RepID=A0A0F9URS5_9ZZZZ